MKIQTILFDLDDTLLGNSMQAFMTHYFGLLGQYAEKYMDQGTFLRELLAATRAVIERKDTAVSNRDLFWSTFQQRTGMNPQELEPYFEQFYVEKFPLLRESTELRPISAKLVQACFDKGLKIVIATNPLFPRSAIEQRLEWAGVPVTQFPYHLVTTYENMNAAKPNPVYYEQILQAVDCAPGAALMVGDDWKNDIEPAAKKGLFTYWVTVDNNPTPLNAVQMTGCGTLETLYDKILSGWLERLGN